MAEIDLAHLQRLAALRLSASEAEQAAKDLTRIIGMIDAMAEIETDGVTPMAHPLDAEQLLRPDRVTETNLREAFQSVAPEADDGFYIVPRVVE